MSYSFYPYLMAMVVVGIGLYAVVCKKNLIKIIVGIIIIDYGVNLFLLLMGYCKDGIAPIRTADMNKEEFIAAAVDPVPQALILTSIVIGLGMVALMTALAVRLHGKYGTFDISRIRRLKG
ncbi:MAG: NADH-quinone oxidoreductase subunit K [Sedimentisphaerales bacterium]|nr:NADH-quinone oxidoreductase subunit K [Sedimentisphaerales bacterium]